MTSLAGILSFRYKTSCGLNVTYALRRVKLSDFALKETILFEILFLGTSASAPSAKRGLSAQIIKHDEYRFLVDCGEGTQRQILQSGAGFKNLTRILLTHGHLDHILGLGGLMSTFMRWEAIEELDIFGGRTTLDRVHDLVYGVVLRGNQAPMPIRMNEIKPGLFFDQMASPSAPSPSPTAGLTAWVMSLRSKRAVHFWLSKQMNSASRLGLSAGNWSPGTRSRWLTAGASHRTMCWAHFKKE